MSVLIKGMEMPKIEGDRVIEAEIRQIDGKLEFGIMTGGYYYAQQWSYFPLVEVPAHGRLIDADALEYMEMETCDTEDSFRIIERVAGRNQIRRIVQNAPTILPADPAEEGEECQTEDNT